MSFEDPTPRLSDADLAAMRNSLTPEDVLAAWHVVDKSRLLNEVNRLNRLVDELEDMIANAGGYLAVANMATKVAELRAEVVTTEPPADAEGEERSPETRSEPVLHP